ncbi:hypothetical protein [Marinimicrobium sp. ARAG 43.8]|uniref:hypothetical protein n=1 Tax=Marinimicrobium sp. ARAG 43.8 TaxID=3418719 RepID=UPI003CEC351D
MDLTCSLRENKYLAMFWGSLSIAIASVGIYSLFTPGKYLVVSFIGLSAILFGLARQRTKYRYNPEKFRNLARNIAFLVVFSSVLAVTTMSNSYVL